MSGNFKLLWRKYTDKFLKHIESSARLFVMLLTNNTYGFNLPISRLVLSAVSDYFAAMFTNDVLEARQEEVKIEGVDPNALNSLVQYAYTGKPPMYIN